MIFRRSVLLVVTVLMCSYGVRAQTLEILTQTDSFTDYVLENDSLRAVYRFELTIPHDGNRQNPGGVPRRQEKFSP